jgi:predicted  nucleic acid-binding Zn-ribbon protein
LLKFGAGAIMLSQLALMQYQLTSTYEISKVIDKYKDDVKCESDYIKELPKRLEECKEKLAAIHKLLEGGKSMKAAIKTADLQSDIKIMDDRIGQIKLNFGLRKVSLKEIKSKINAQKVLSASQIGVSDIFCLSSLAGLTNPLTAFPSMVNIAINSFLIAKNVNLSGRAEKLLNEINELETKLVKLQREVDCLKSTLTNILLEIEELEDKNFRI